MRPIRGLLPPAAALLLLLLLVSARSTLWDRDEARFGTAAREMAASGNLLTPTFNGELRAQKPALPTWLMAASVRLLGPSEVAVRLWSALALTVAALVTGVLGGPLALLVLAATPLALVEGTAATADGLLLAFLTGALAVHWAALESGYRARHVAALGLLLGLAQLAKGPVGLALPLLAFAFARLLSRERGAAGARPILAATLLSVALFAAWAIPANRATDGRYLAFGMGHEVLTRMATPLEGHGGSPLLALPYYLPVLLVGFAPWTLYLPAALAGLVARRRDPRTALLLAWVATPFALFTLVATKLPHYVLPAWPALAVAVARVVDRAAAGEVSERWLRHGRTLFGATQGLLACGLAAAGLLAPPLRVPCFAGAALVAATSVLALRFHRLGRHRQVAWGLGAASLVGLAGTALAVLPLVETWKPVPRLAARIPAGAPVATLDFAEPSLDFYVGRPPIRRLASADEARSWLSGQARGVVVLPGRSLARLVAGEAGSFHVVASERGFNLAKGEWVELVALERTP